MKSFKLVLLLLISSLSLTVMAETASKIQSECNELFDKNDELHNVCVKSSVSLKQKKYCADFNKKFLKNVELKERINCMDTTERADSLALVLKKLDDYKVVTENDKFKIWKLRSSHPNEEVENYWDIKSEYMSFLNTILTTKYKLAARCIDYFEDTEDNANLERAERCIVYETTKDDIKKCQKIGLRAATHEQIMKCLDDLQNKKTQVKSESEDRKPAAKKAHNSKKKHHK